MYALVVQGQVSNIVRDDMYPFLDKPVVEVDGIVFVAIPESLTDILDTKYAWVPEVGFTPPYQGYEKEKEIKKRIGEVQEQMNTLDMKSMRTVRSIKAWEARSQQRDFAPGAQEIANHTEDMAILIQYEGQAECLREKMRQLLDGRLVDLDDSPTGLLSQTENPRQTP